MPLSAFYSEKKTIFNKYKEKFNEKTKKNNLIKNLMKKKKRENCDLRK